MPISKAEQQARKRERRGDRRPVCDEDRCRSNTLAGDRCPNARVTLTLPISKVGKKKVFDPENGEPKRVRLKTCLAHAPENYRRAAGFVGHGQGGRPRKPTVPQVMREMIETQAGEVMQPFFDGLQAERPVVVGNGAHAKLEMVPDPSVRIRAADGILDRVYGRPKQTTELTGLDGGAVAVTVPTTDERKAAVADVLREAGVAS